jgi:predicted  nucleic acid-binding Zn-ribbon protein
MVKASTKVMKKLRALGRAVDALTQQSRNYSRACEAGREFRERLRSRISELEETIVHAQLEELARRDNERYGPKLRAIRSELNELNEQFAESKAEEEEIREQWSELNMFVSSNSDRLDKALRYLGKHRSDLGVPFGERTNARADVVIR